MRDKLYNELALERAIEEKFGVELDIGQYIVNKVPISPTSNATLFLTTQKQLFLYLDGQSRLLFGDVRKLVSRMGLVADTYMPPKNQPNYFDEVAIGKFQEVFPGRKHINKDDIRFYKTLVPYNPALILISGVKDGQIYRYDSDSITKWRVATKFSYRRIKTS